MTTGDPPLAAGKIVIDKRINLGALINAAALMLHLVVLISGGLWIVAMMDAKVDSLTANLTAFKADVTGELIQLRADLSADTERLDNRVDTLHDHAAVR